MYDKVIKSETEYGYIKYIYNDSPKKTTTSLVQFDEFDFLTKKHIFLIIYTYIKK